MRSIVLEHRTVRNARSFAGARCGALAAIACALATLSACSGDPGARAASSSGSVGGAASGAVDAATTSTSGATGGAGAGGAGEGGGGGDDDTYKTVCNDDCVYVRDGATGDGSNWAKALPALPSSLERGKVYLVAAGDYASRTFDDPPSGDLTIIIKKASADDHGTDAGWDASFGSGKATFGRFDFETSNYVVDGGPGLGLVVKGSFLGSVVRVEETADHVTLRRCDLDGNFAKNANDEHTGGACSGILGNRPDYLTVEGCEVHNVADDGMQLSRMNYAAIRNNVVHDLHACGTDAPCSGPCNNGHSDGLELASVKNSVIEGNFIHHVTRVSAVFFSGQPDPTSDWMNEDLVIANNVFYTPETGIVAYFQKANRIQVYHNVFWGKHKGTYGGIAIGQYLNDLHLYDNIILSINLSHMKATFDAAQHHADYNLLGVDVGQFPVSSHDVLAGDPLFEGVPDLDGAALSDPKIIDFFLKAGSPAIDAGWTGGPKDPMPPLDMLGKPRVGAPDLGALERQ